MSALPPERVDSTTIRQIFNNCQELKTLVIEKKNKTLLKSKKLSNPEKKGLPNGTYSESFSYRNENGSYSVIVHQYTLPDGQIGASGQPDPKRVQIKGKIYFV
jgi:hypothetical protein